MRLIRLALALLFCAVAGTAIYNFCWMRYRCNVERKIIDVRVRQVLDEATTDWVRAETGRASIDRLRPCIANDPADYQLLELLARAQLAAGQPEEAVSSYEAALQLNETPQTHAAVAALYFELQQPTPAYEHLLQAAYFSPAFAWTADPALLEQLQRDVERRATRLRGKARASS